MDNKMTYALIALLLGAAGGFYFGKKKCPCGPAMAPSSSIIPSKQWDLADTLHKLWADHVIWTRQYIVSTVAGLADAPVAANRLMKNQEDIGNAIATVYGPEAGTKLTALLKDHIKIAADVVAAAKANNQDAYKAADEKWKANALEIADFLSAANPQNWPKDVMEKMLLEHLAVTTDEVVARLKGAWDDDIKAFDKVFNQVLGMAGDLTKGIIAQFPDKFK